MPAGPTDAIASLRTFPITVTLGSEEFTLERRPALTWLEALVDDPPNLTLIIPGMLAEADQLRFDDTLLSGQVKLEDLGDAILDAVAVASGRPWWTALGLIRLLCTNNRPLLIRATAMVDLNVIPLGAWCDLVYIELARNMKHEDWVRFDSDLMMPPPGVDVDPAEVIDERASEQAFLSMVNQPAR